MAPAELADGFSSDFFGTTGGHGVSSRQFRDCHPVDFPAEFPEPVGELLLGPGNRERRLPLDEALPECEEVSSPG